MVALQRLKTWDNSEWHSETLTEKKRQTVYPSSILLPSPDNWSSMPFLWRLSPLLASFCTASSSLYHMSPDTSRNVWGRTSTSQGVCRVLTSPWVPTLMVTEGTGLDGSRGGFPRKRIPSHIIFFLDPFFSGFNEIGVRAQTVCFREVTKSLNFLSVKCPGLLELQHLSTNQPPRDQSYNIV